MAPRASTTKLAAHLSYPGRPHSIVGVTRTRFRRTVEACGSTVVGRLRCLKAGGPHD
jgi:hypothetical protein